MFVVRCRVFGHVREYLPGGRDAFEVEVEAPETIARVIARLGVDPQLFMAALVDGQRRDKDFVIDRDCELVLLSPAAGG